MNHALQADYRTLYQEFIDIVSEVGVIWVIGDDDGVATCESEDFEDRQVLLFWASEEAAMSQCVEEWSHYRAMPIDFDDFIDQWLHGMDADEHLAGINWDSELVGPEIEPVKLIDDLLEEE